MNRKLAVTAEARNDVIEAFYYLAERSESVADRFWAAADATFQHLAQQPMGERLRPRNVLLHELRLWHIEGFENHLVFYRVTDDAVEIIRVLHAAREWMTILHKQFSG